MAAWIEIMSTTLPWTSTKEYGSLYFYYNCNVSVGMFTLQLYCTTDSVPLSDVDEFATNDWRSLGSKSFPSSLGTAGAYFAFSSEHFNRANSIALHIYPGTGSGEYVTVQPNRIYYCTSAAEILDSGGEMGGFSYLVTDGGKNA